MEKLNDIITEQGLKVSGMGMVANNLDKLLKLQDRNNFLLSRVEDKLDRLLTLLELHLGNKA